MAFESSAKSPLQIEHERLMAAQLKEIGRIGDLRRLGMPEEADEHARRFREATERSATIVADQNSSPALDAMRAATKRKPGSA